MKNDWLQRINLNTPINQLALPGTHDSAAWTKYSSIPSSTPGTWAQRNDITEQLNLGIRVLDLRVGYASDNYSLGMSSFVGMFHGPIYLNVTLEDILTAINTWMNANPSEFVILIFQQQGKPFQRDVSGEVNNLLQRTFVGKLFNFQAAANTWPTVGNLRGKVMTLGRLRSHVAGFCDLRTWLTDGDNTDGRMLNAGDHLRIFLQDRYKQLSSDTGYVSRANDNSKKFAKVEDAAVQIGPDSRVMIINHMSYSNLRYQPWQSGEGVNQLLLLRARRLVIKGMFMIDDADAVTVNHILQNNP